MADRRNARSALPDPARSSCIPAVPPGSTALREFCHVVATALTLSDSAMRSGVTWAGPDELAHLRSCRDRARLVVRTMRRMLADREIDDHDIMMFVVSLREQLSDHPAEIGNHAGGSS